MAISIDGKIHNSDLKVKYGEEFPKPNRSTTLISKEHGEILVYITRIGIPEWNKDYTINLPIKFYITEIIEPSKEYKKEQKIKKVGLRLIKGD